MCLLHSSGSGCGRGKYSLISMSSPVTWDWQSHTGWSESWSSVGACITVKFRQGIPSLGWPCYWNISPVCRLLKPGLPSPSNINDLPYPSKKSPPPHHWIHTWVFEGGDSNDSHTINVDPRQGKAQYYPNGCYFLDRGVYISTYWQAYPVNQW